MLEYKFELHVDVCFTCADDVPDQVDGGAEPPDHALCERQGQQSNPEQTQEPAVCECPHDDIAAGAGQVEQVPGAAGASTLNAKELQGQDGPYFITGVPLTCISES